MQRHIYWLWSPLLLLSCWNYTTEVRSQVPASYSTNDHTACTLQIEHLGFRVDTNGNHIAISLKTTLKAHENLWIKRGALHTAIVIESGPGGASTISAGWLPSPPLDEWMFLADGESFATEFKYYMGMDIKKDIVLNKMVIVARYEFEGTKKQSDRLGKALTGVWSSNQLVFFLDSQVPVIKWRLITDPREEEKIDMKNLWGDD